MAKRAAIATKKLKTKAGKKPARSKQGTSIDDSAVLAKLASTLRRSPELAVTAALKKIGVKDQASLRRIAGKYTKEKAAAKRAAAAARRKKSRPGKSARAEMAAQPLLSATPAIKRSAPGKPSSTSKKSPKKTAAKPAKAVRSKRARMQEPRIGQSPSAKLTTASAAHRTGTAATNAGASPLTPWVNTGLDLSTAAFTTQLQLFSQMMKMAPVKTMLQQQMEFNSAMVSLFKVPLTGFLNGRKKPKSK